jgi:ribosomal protein L11 methyltransferase
VKWVAARVAFEGADPGRAAENVATCFFDLGLKGVVMEDPGLAPADGWGAGAVTPPQEHAVTGYFEDDARTAERCRRLESALADLAQAMDLRHRLTYTRVDEADWAEAWKEFFYPEIISPGLVVKPSWREYAARPGETVIEIDPGMAFGTGTHPTTVMCLRLIEKYLRPSASFLDVGTGSGILMITAAKLGARTVTGVDNDPTAVAVARENLAANFVPKERITVHTGDLISTVEGRFDLVAANILAEVIVKLAPDLPLVMAPGACVICSGIIRSNAETVAAELKAAGLAILETCTQEEWVAMVAAKFGWQPET